MVADDGQRSPESSDGTDGAAPTSDGSATPVARGRYSWRSFLKESGYADAAEALYADIDEEPTVPSDVVAAHAANGDGRVVRVSGVDEAFVADGDTPVPGRDPPSEGTLVVGDDHVVVSGRAVIPTGTSTAAVVSDAFKSDLDGDSTAESAEAGASETDATPSGADSDDAVGDEADGDGDEAAVDDEADEDAEPDGDDEDAEPDDAFDLDVGDDGVPGTVAVAAADVETVPSRTPTEAEWERVDVDPSDFLGFDPSETALRLYAGAAVGDVLWDRCSARYNLYEVPVLKGYYTWDDYRDEYFLDEDGNPPLDEDEEPLSFTHEDKAEALGFDPDQTETLLSAGESAAADLADLVEERTVNVNPDVDEDAFFSTETGDTTLANRYDLEKAVPMPKKTHFREIERYWVNKPYAFVIVFRSTKENEVKYYAIQPYQNDIEADLVEFLTGKLRTSIKYADESIAGGDEEFRKEVIVEETLTLLDRYGLYEHEDDDRGLLEELVDDLVDRFGFDLTEGIFARITESLGYHPPTTSSPSRRKIPARPEPAVLAEDPDRLSTAQVEKLVYYLKRDFIGYERIDPIKYDINVEDISCDGYNSPVFVYHSDYEQIITNIYHGTDELDDFVVKLAQRSGKGISKRRPQVDATLADGSRAQLTLGREVSDHGTNYTIRQFNDVPFTPIDLINWNTFSLDQMAFLWLAIENHKSLIFAGGTASGKTTSLNAVSLFIPSNAKIVSIEDTREVELPQRNWIASVTRPSFSDDDKGDIDEFNLLEAALRQRPDYIVMGEIRGEEGRTAFQVMSTGHTTYTTFHADSVGEVLKRFTTEPINVSKTMFTALDLVSVQTSTRVQGKKVRRTKSLTEINHYDAENDEINVQDVFQWQAETDEYLQMGDSNTLEDIMFDRGWSRAVLNDELEKRRVVLAYLIDRGLNSYAQVAATFMAFINDPETVLALMANDQLERSLEDLREMESVLINVEPGKEEMIPRPEPDEAGKKEVEQILAEAEDLFAEYRGKMPDSVAEALINLTPDPDIEASPDDSHEMLEQTAREAEARYPEPIGPARPDTAPADDGVAAYGTAGDVGIDADDLAVRADDLIATTNDVTAGADDVVVSVADLAANGSDRSVTADAVQHPGGSQDRAAPDDGADSPTSTRDDPVEPAAVDPALSNPEPVRPPDAGGNGSVASGSDADADSGSSTIDFDDPFDEGINVMEADAEAQETAASSLEKDGFDSSTGTDRAVDDAVEAATTDDAVEAATTDDATTALTDVDERGTEAEDPDAGDVEDNADAADRTGDAAIADEDVAAATEHGGTDDEDSDGNDDEDGDDEDGDDDADEADIDSWGFGTVEPPEEEG